MQRQKEIPSSCLVEIFSKPTVLVFKSQICFLWIGWLGKKGSPEIGFTYFLPSGGMLKLNQ